MPTTKKVNYTEAQEQEMKAVYESCENEDRTIADTQRSQAVEQLAIKFGKTPASIRSKLARMEVYIRPEKVSQATGKKAVRKPELTAQLALKLGVPAKETVSGEKATKSFLEMVLLQMTTLENRITELEAEIAGDIEVDNSVTD